jgi:hypothetical protein
MEEASPFDKKMVVSTDNHFDCRNYYERTGNQLDPAKGGSII